jgi:hypothetical protein
MFVTDGERVRAPLRGPLQQWRTDGRTFIWDPEHELHVDVTGATPAQRKAAIANLVGMARVAEGLPPYETDKYWIASKFPNLFEWTKPLTKAQRAQRKRWRTA